MPSLVAAWAATVRQAPDAPALIDAGSGQQWSRAALAAAAREWAVQERPAALAPGHRVVLAEPNGIAWWRVFLGLLEARCVPVPIDPAEPALRRQEVATAIRAAGVWAQGSWTSAPAPGCKSRPPIALAKLTSGSTGSPRALLFSHAQMRADGDQVCASMGLRPTDLNLAVIPLGHSYGLGNLVVPLLVQGIPILCAGSPLPQSLAADCSRYRPTVFPAVPPLLRALARADLEPALLASLRLVISAGAPLPAETAAAFAAKFGRRVHSFYGTSETGGICYDRTGESTLVARSVGTPLSGVRLQFDRRGRLVVSSPAVGGRGQHRPADRAELNAEGELVLLGRRGRMVKIGARRLNLGEIESALRTVPGIREVFVTIHPAKPDSLAAAVSGGPASDAVRARLLARLPAWKVPARLLVLPEFPVTARGKTDTRRLRAWLADGHRHA